jgi:hypothetical protein
MPAHVRIDHGLMAKLRKVEGPVLADLLPVCTRQVGATITISQVLVPRGEVDTDGKPALSTTDFVDAGINAAKKSVGATCGYEHPQAGPIHEGWHYGAKVFESPTHFLRKAHRSVRGKFRGAVAKQVKATLSRLFPST